MERPRHRNPGGRSGEAPLVLMCCTHRFESPTQVGSQHLARQFVKNGWRVAYVSAPVTPLHLLRGPDREFFRRMRLAMAPASRLGGALLEAVPLAFMAPYGGFGLNSRAVLEHWHRTAIPSLRGLAQRLGAEAPDLVYIDNIFLGAALDAVRPGRSVLRVMDDHGAFPGFERRGPQAAASVAARVDCTAYSATGLKPYVENVLKAPNPFYVPNAVDCGLYSGDVLPHPALSGALRPVILHVGTLDRRLDVPLMRRMAAELPEFDFVYAGPRAEGVDFGEPLPNLQFPGTFPHGELPALMAAARAFFVPFDVAGQVRRLAGCRSLKLYEASAAGLTVVSARWPDAEEGNGPILFYDSPGECAALLRRAVSDPRPTEMCREFARANDWSASFAELMRHVGI